jgi:hypothetical protein
LTGTDFADPTRSFDEAVTLFMEIYDVERDEAEYQVSVDRGGARHTAQRDGKTVLTIY